MNQLLSQIKFTNDFISIVKSDLFVCFENQFLYLFKVNPIALETQHLLYGAASELYKIVFTFHF